MFIFPCLSTIGTRVRLCRSRACQMSRKAQTYRVMVILTTLELKKVENQFPLAKKLLFDIFMSC
jgi:hypothetical protein